MTILADNQNLMWRIFTLKATSVTIFMGCKHRNFYALVFDHYVTQIILPEKNPIRHMRWYVQIVK